MACGLIARRGAIATLTQPDKRRLNRPCRPSKADAGELVLLSQEEARVAMAPTLRTTPGLKGHRPVVGNLDDHDLVDVFGALHLLTGRLTTRLGARGRAHSRRLQRPSRQRYMPAALARHVRGIGRAYPAAQSPQVVLVIDHAPWHQGGLITTVRNQRPQLRLSRLPSHSPQRQVIERCWKVLRRRATHHRLFPAQARVTQALRNSLCSYRTLKPRVLS